LISHEILLRSNADAELGVRLAGGTPGGKLGSPRQVWGEGPNPPGPHFLVAGAP